MYINNLLLPHFIESWKHVSEPAQVPCQPTAGTGAGTSASCQGSCGLKTLLSKCLFMLFSRLLNSLRINPTLLLLITGALERWCLSALQDFDLSYIIYSHSPGKTFSRGPNTCSV